VIPMAIRNIVIIQLADTALMEKIFINSGIAGFKELLFRITVNVPSKTVIRTFPCSDFRLIPIQ
jgi:hypothetical protein